MKTQQNISIEYAIFAKDKDNKENLVFDHQFLTFDFKHLTYF
jgi:hypothetical protein